MGARIPDPKALQQTWLLPGSMRRGPTLKFAPTTVTVTLPNGAKVEGRLDRLDDFVVSLIDNDGAPSSFRRDGDVPKVDVHDPLKPHRDLLNTYTDKKVHDLTAYLVTLK